MTLNALTAACNQKSNRDPVVEYGEKTVVRTLDSLRDKELVRVVSGHDARVPKYYHRFTDVRGFSEPEVAVLCELMLRGSQTPGELRSRGSRMHRFEDLAAVEAALEALANREAGAAVVRLPRQPGFKESRFAHLLGDPPGSRSPRATARPAPENRGGPGRKRRARPRPPKTNGSTASKPPSPKWPRKSPRCARGSRSSSGSSNRWIYTTTHTPATQAATPAAIGRESRSPRNRTARIRPNTG